MLKITALSAAVILAGALPLLAAETARPTIVLVHGAFAGGESWDKVATKLKHDHYPVVVAANQLRHVQGDAASVAALLKTIAGPVVLVGHSYGGVVISNAARANANVKALVYVAGFAPESGESAATLSAKYPGSVLSSAILPAPMSPTEVDLYIQRPRFHAVFAADVPPGEVQHMQISQRPVTQAALEGRSGEPAWKELPSWFIYGDADQCIPAEAHAFMAQRAGSRQTIVEKGASHALMISHPAEVGAVIERAAASTLNAATKVD